jgi:hypothetical protein
MQNLLPLNDNGSNANSDAIDLGKELFIKVRNKHQKIAELYKHGILIRSAKLSDLPARRLFITEAVEMGAMKSRLAKALGISRQTIDNNVSAKKFYGVEGLVHGYSAKEKISKKVQRKQHSKQLESGIKAKQIAEIKRERRQQEKQNAPHSDEFDFFNEAQAAPTLEEDEQPFSGEHDWQATRYAGIGIYWVALLARWNWLTLTINHFGSGWKIFAVFMLMVSQNVRSIEQLKNIRSKEAAIILGLKKLPSRPVVWQWFYQVAEQGNALTLLQAYFSHQMRNGLVGLWLWFTDGHLLPYTGKHKVHYAYNTQRRMPVPGRTSQVTCDASGRIVDFVIEEGKGNMKQVLLNLHDKWGKEVGAARPINVFDREGYDGKFFQRQIEQGTAFVSWDKYVDTKKLALIEDEKYTRHFEFNSKKYSIFEEEKHLSYGEAKNKKTVTLRRIQLWNRSSNRRTSVLAWNPDVELLDMQACAEAILSRWGSSENTFKHLQTRHPFHYMPGFKIKESERQEIANPKIVALTKEIATIKKTLNRLYKNSAKYQGDTRASSKTKDTAVKQEIAELEKQITQLQKEKKAAPEKVDVKGLEDYRSFKKIDDEGKYLFDFVTTSVWNARKEMVDWLSDFYHNKNELVDFFYAISCCHGWVKSERDIVRIRLESLGRGQKGSAQEQFCRKLSSFGVRLPNGKRIIVEVGTAP